MRCAHFHLALRWLAALPFPHHRHPRPWGCRCCRFLPTTHRRRKKVALGGEEDAISEAAARGFQVFLAEGRCVSCHTIEQNQSLFTDHHFHNIGVGINDIQQDCRAWPRPSSKPRRRERMWTRRCSRMRMYLTSAVSPSMSK